MESFKIELSQVEVDVLYHLMQSCGGNPDASLRCIANKLSDKLEGMESAQSDMMEDEFDELSINFRSTGVGAQIANPSAVPSAWR